MSFLSAAHVFAFLAYVFVGLRVLIRNPRSRLSFAFALACASFATWALADAFAHGAATREEYESWMAATRFSVVLGPGFLLHFVLILVERARPSLARRLLHAAAIYSVTTVFLLHALEGPLVVESVERSSLGWVEIPDQGSLWFWAFTAYYSICTGTAFFLTWRWGQRGASERQRLQARVVVLCGATALVLIVVAQAVVPAVWPRQLPSIDSLLTLPWIGGSYWAISRYGFLELTAEVAANDIVETMPDALLLVDPRGIVRAVNSAVQRIFGWPGREVVGRSWRMLLDRERSPAPDRLVALLHRAPIERLELVGRNREDALVPLVTSVSRVGAIGHDSPGFVVVLRDDTARRKSEEWIHHLAHHDVLTGLPNRLLFQDRLQQALLRARSHGQMVGVLMLDLDRLKEVNDTFGHDVGDLLLKAVAARLGTAIRKSDTAARLGGDEFAVALPEIRQLSDAELVAQRILESLETPLDLAGHAVRGSASIGIAVHPEHGDDPAQLMRNADLAMYRAKQSGRSACRSFDPSMTESLDRRTLEHRLRAAFEQRQLVLHYQPQIELASGRTLGVEALLRWHDPERGLVPPLEFIPLAEECGLIVPIGEWILRTACAQAAAWRAAGLGRLRMAVNVSGRQLLRDDFGDLVAANLKRVRLDPGDLELELTEEATHRDPARALQTLQRLHESGVHVAVDDLGTGSTSLSFLARFPGRTLKIAQNLVRELPERSENRTIVEGILALAGELRFERVVAEGVETDEQLEYLRTAGCPVVQGFVSCRPVTAQELGARLADGRLVANESAAVAPLKGATP